MRIIEEIRKFSTLLRNALIWTSFYVLIGVLFIYIGHTIQQYSVISVTLISIGGSILAIGLVTILIEVNSSWHVLQILHMYGDHKTHGIYRVFQDTKDSEYQDLYKSATRNPKLVKVLALIGRKYTESEDAIAYTMNLVKASNASEFLFINFNSHGYNYRYENMEPINNINPIKNDGDVVGKSNAQIFINNFEILKSSVEALNDPRKQVRFYNTVPIFNLEFFDDLLFISFYGLKSRSRNRSPIFVFQKRKSKVYDYFFKQFDEYWNDTNQQN